MAESSKYFVTPGIVVLSDDQKERVHEFSVRILETTGIRVESDRARKIFARSRSVIIKDDVVYIKRELIDRSIKTARSEIEIYNRSGDHLFKLGKEQEGGTRFGIGVTNTSFQEIETDMVVPFTRGHMKISSRLGDILPNFDMISTLGIPSDLPPSEIDLYNTLDMYANTAKPLVLLISESKNINRVFDLLSFLHGDISSSPFAMLYLNLITPLVLNESTTDKMIAALERGLPVIFSNYSMYGATSPMTEAGTLALLNAELLAGLVLSQLVKEGSKIILGSLPAGFDMKIMGSYYSPSSYLLNLACAEMMDHYDIPHCGTSGSGRGWGPDLIASGHLWMNHLTSCLGKVGMAPFVGGNFDSLAFSPATAVLSDHIIGEARKFASGFSLADERIGLDEIKDTGHGGNYFLSRYTIESLHEPGGSDEVWPPLNLNKWNDSANPTAKSILIDRTMELYSEASRLSGESEYLTGRGESFIKNNG
ncbi:MAG TPA: trimethylamine methyltransferase family protein [Bacteroidales bacterium]|nr:trimethylamine methyltransferase family protein [Bacteroidales bacterium]